MAEGTLSFLDDLFAELCEAFPQSPLFHVGGDEVWGFARDARCAAMVAESGEEGVYAFHLNNLQRLLARRGRRWPSGVTKSCTTPRLPRP